jgi:hypothetical protein
MVRGQCGTVRYLVEHDVVPLAQAVAARRLLLERMAVQDVVVALRCGTGRTGSMGVKERHGHWGQAARWPAGLAVRVEGLGRGMGGAVATGDGLTAGLLPGGRLTARGGHAQMNMLSKPRSLASCR